MKKRAVLSILLVLMLVFSSAAAYAEGHEDMDMEAVETEEEAVEGEEEAVEEEATEEEATEEETVEEVEEEVEEVKAAAASVQLTINNATALVDGEAVALDVAPFISEGRTMVPLAFISEQLGAEVVWNGEERSVTYTKGETVIVLIIDAATAWVNGEEVELDVAPMIHVESGRTVVPVNFISTMLGYEVEWNAVTRTVTIAEAMETEEEVTEEETVEEEVVEEDMEEVEEEEAAAEEGEEEASDEEAVEGEETEEV